MAGLLPTRFIRWFKIAAVLSAVIVFAMVVYFPNLSKLKQLRAENAKLAKEQDNLRVKINELRENIEAVKTDPSLFEQLARDTIGVAKEDEIVIDIEE
ncbi:MAG: septum formation initiator family protein [Candidatus Omnitrophota bacterium]